MTSAIGSPADFDEWVRRSLGRNTAPFPDIWRRRGDLVLDDPARVAVVLHAFYADLVPELVTAIAQIPIDVDLIVTNATGHDLEIDHPPGSRVRTTRILEVSNHGRDILPLVSCVNAGLLDPYEVVLKVHTKRSEWRATHELSGTGDMWRAELLDGLVGSTTRIEEILGAFAARADLGIVSADGSVLGAEYWGDNELGVATLLRRIELTHDESALRFAAGSMYWIRGFLLQGLRAFNLGPADFEPEAGQVNRTTAHAIERLLGVVAAESGLRVVEVSEAVQYGQSGGFLRYDASAKRTPRARIVPFYLPQFHAIPENDRWWGKGFTEWTNVAPARPVYHGHHQPKIPTELGFYDLTCVDVRSRQAALAEEHGVAGFMYYYYWFAGRRLLERPITSLVHEEGDFPFAIMWANENWTRRWDGRSEDILIGQDYDVTPAANFIDDIMPFLADPRYLRIDGRCLLSVYRPGQMEDFADVVATWRARAAMHNIELFVVSVDIAQGYDELVGSVTDNGLDGIMAFPPHNCRWEWIRHEGLGVVPGFAGNILSYSALVEHQETEMAGEVSHDFFPGVMVTFDNTARRPLAGDLWLGSNPFTFRRWLMRCVQAVALRAPEERIVFVNAWNEWAEGAVLEPSDRFGRTYLQAVRDVAWS